MKFAYNGTPIKVTVEYGLSVFCAITGITDREFYYDIDKCVNAWKVGLQTLHELYGDRLPVRIPAAPQLAYCHLASIGGKISVPEEGEPNIRPFASDIDEAIDIMQAAKSVDFGDNDLCRHYIEINRRLQEAFPQYKIGKLSGYNSQGVLTSAVLMRGQDFLMDLYDEPEKCTEFLDLMTDNLIAFGDWARREQDVPLKSENGYIYDDFAALVPPYMWREFVIPYWNRSYESRSTGRYRFAHCEDLRAAHLPYLKEAGVTEYQPSLSNSLTPALIKATTDIPFDWMLQSWDILKMSDEEIHAWIADTLAAGATSLTTQFDAYNWTEGKMDRTQVFFDAIEQYRVE